MQILGTVGDMDTEMDCLLRENLVDLTPFSARALACLPNVGDGNEWTIHDEEVQKRRDLRMDCRIFSVDPVGCQDIDDAMHAKGTLLCRCDPKETVGECTIPFSFFLNRFAHRGYTFRSSRQW